MASRAIVLLTKFNACLVSVASEATAHVATVALQEGVAQLVEERVQHLPETEEMLRMPSVDPDRRVSLGVRVAVRPSSSTVWRPLDEQTAASFCGNLAEEEELAKDSHRSLQDDAGLVFAEIWIAEALAYFRVDEPMLPFLYGMVLRESKERRPGCRGRTADWFMIDGTWVEGRYGEMGELEAVVLKEGERRACSLEVL